MAETEDETDDETDDEIGDEIDDEDETEEIPVAFHFLPLVTTSLVPLTHQMNLR